MARLVVLDTEVLGLACAAPGRPEADRCNTRLDALDLAGVLVFIPAIADYEVRRGLLLAGADDGIRRLDNLARGPAFVPVTVEALRLAAELWAQLRRDGQPTASPHALDGDCIVAAQALLLCGHGDALTIATRNVRHFTRFPGVDARPWEEIAP